MESPPSCSAWSGLISSEDSGLLITSSSVSSGIEYPESEDEKSYCDPDEDSLCDESNFNTVKKVEWHHKTIDPPLEFQDTPTAAFRVEGRRAVTPPPFSSPRRSLSTSRLSSSHNSLTIPMANKADDSSFITSAMSHDMLTDLYNVPLDSDIYTLPIDTIKPRNHHKKPLRHGKRRRRHTAVECEVDCQKPVDKKSSKRHSAPGQGEPVHMTLQEVRQFLHTLYSGGESNSETNHRECKLRQQEKRKHRSKHKPQSICSEEKTPKTSERSKKSSGVKNSFSHLLKRTLCNMFRVKKPPRQTEGVIVLGVPKVPSFTERALPPLPEKVTVPTLLSHNDEAAVDFASSIEKVKDYGWYWGPISGEAAEKVLSDEPDGSFIVRDSSDQHYIFSLTFTLNGCVRHVRIEHGQGNFSFGSCTKFKSQTIVEFIETAVEHSRSGRYLFFLHRHPILGPMRVQLLHPVSRFKHVQSLQHMCRFVILKSVRRDLLPSLPLPRRLIDYLSSPHYYSEQLIEHPDQEPSSPSSLHFFSFMPPH